MGLTSCPPSFAFAWGIVFRAAMFALYIDAPSFAALGYVPGGKKLSTID